MNRDDIYQLIEDYQEGNLSETERKDFEQRLKTDKELANAWNLSRELDEALSPDALELEQLLDDIGSEFIKEAPKSDKKPTGINWKLLLAGIGLVALMVLAWKLWDGTQEEEMDTQQIFASLYEPYPAPSETRSIDAGTRGQIEAAHSQYEAKDYTQAIALYSTILENDSLEQGTRSSIQFYKGLSHLNMNELAISKAYLSELDSGPYQQQALWYLAMIALKENDTETAKTKANEVLGISTSGKFANQARELIKLLE